MHAMHAICTQPEPRYAQPSRKQKPPPEAQPVAYGWNPVGVLLLLYYLGAALYYFWVRATRTLNIGYTRCVCAACALQPGGLACRAGVSGPACASPLCARRALL